MSLSAGLGTHDLTRRPHRSGAGEGIGRGWPPHRAKSRSYAPLSPPQDELVTRPLTELLAVSFGPLPVLTGLLADVDNIDEAYIYGSWAARYQGQPGSTPNDVDVLVIGNADRDELDDVAERAQRRLRREVNIGRVATQRWHDPGSDPSSPACTNARWPP